MLRWPPAPEPGSRRLPNLGSGASGRSLLSRPTTRKGRLRDSYASVARRSPTSRSSSTTTGRAIRTSAVAAAAGAHVITLPFNIGIGGAVQTGYHYALANGFDIQLHLILEPLVAGEADIVIGSRFAGAGSYRAARFGRVGMRVFASIVSMIVRQPLTDTSSSFRALNRRSLSLFASDYPHGFLETVGATVLAGKYHLRLQEVPVTMRERELGRSSLTIRLSLSYLAKVLLALFVGLFRRPAVRLEEEP